MGYTGYNGETHLEQLLSNIHPCLSERFMRIKELNDLIPAIVGLTIKENLNCTRPLSSVLRFIRPINLFVALIKFSRTINSKN